MKPLRGDGTIGAATALAHGDDAAWLSQLPEGEVACIADRVWGLVGPGYTMAEVVADRMLGGAAAFTGADLSTKLKLMGGSITAALFLREFTGGRPWAHLDIAGPAFTGSDEDERTKGGTGYGVRLLTAWLAELAGTKAVAASA